MKKKRILPLLLALLVVGFFLGPSPDKPDYSNLEMDAVPKDIHQLDQYLEDEKKGLNIREGNESFIKWADPDSIYQSEYALVFLHGFSASPIEGHPVCEDLAKEFNMNYYAPLLAEHGLVEDETMLNFSPEKWMASALEAIEVGKSLGKKVVLISSSTGGTASLFASAKNDPAIQAQILYSPNIDLYDPRSFVLTLPWGLNISRMISGSDYYEWEAPEGAEKYWHTKYRIEALTELKAMINSSMTKETFSKVKIPTLVAYYYKDEENCDDVVSIDAMKDMIGELGVAKEDLQVEVLADVNAHSMMSGFFTEDAEAVKSVSREFLKAQLD